MKNLEDELKILRDSDNKPIPKLEDLEAMAQRIADPNYLKPAKVRSFVSRLLPECYTTFNLGNFSDFNLKTVHEETLFFIFYALPESDLQIKAYNELISKGYLYSRTLELFLFINEGKVADNRKKNVLAFLPNEWEKVSIEVVFDSGFIGGLESFLAEVC